MSVPLLDVNAQNHALKDELRSAFDRVLESGFFIGGPEIESLENEIAEFVGAKHAIGVSSGTDALVCSLMALGIGPGDEVLCPSFTFFATAGSIFRTGALPVFVDCDPVDFNICLDSARSKMTSRTKVIMPVHLFGQSCDMNAIVSFANEFGLAVIEDAAQAIGARYQGQGCGAIGDYGTYSFFPSKNLGGLGDGGMVVTNDDELAELARKMRNHGMAPRYYHQMVGGNFRLDAVQAALLRVKFTHYGDYTRGRQENAAYYLEKLSALEGVVLSDDAAAKDAKILLPVTRDGNEHIWNQFTLRVKNGQRDNFKQFLADRGVASEIYYPVPMHQQECFESLSEHSLGALPVTEMLSAEVISLPIYAELTPEQRDEVVAAVTDYIAQA